MMCELTFDLLGKLRRFHLIDVSLKSCKVGFLQKIDYLFLTD